MIYCGVEQSGSSSGSIRADTKLKADIAESAATTALLKRGFRVLRPFGDRLPYDLSLDIDKRLVRIQVKSAWYDKSKSIYSVDCRRTKTNRRRMIRQRYSKDDFDFAMIYLDDLNVFYIMPQHVFSSYKSTISIIEKNKRQRKPRSFEYRERWDLLLKWVPRLETIE